MEKEAIQDLDLSKKNLAELEDLSEVRYFLVLNAKIFFFFFFLFFSTKV